MSQRIALITLGSFSHTNDKVRDILQQKFPDYELDAIDLQGTELFSVPNRLATAVGAVMRYPPWRLASRDDLIRSMMRTPTFLGQARKVVHRRLGSKEYAFSFQTQSLFDASRDGLPHFVYTDHTHLANLSYPGFDRAKLASADWIEGEGDIYRRATAVLTMSSNISASVIDQYRVPPAKVECVFVGSNAQVPAESTLSPQRFASKVVLFVGVEWERKGGPELVSAFRKLLTRHPDAKLVVVGCSPQVDLPAANHEVIGRVPLAKVPDYYRQASVFCLPTRLEPFGIVFLEAYAHGLPVVATRIGAIPDFVIDGKTGYVVTPGREDELYASLDRLLSSPSECETLGRNGRTLVVERYSWERTGDRIADVIRKFISADRHRDAGGGVRPAAMK